jgi:hypothetical protein
MVRHHALDADGQGQRHRGQQSLLLPGEGLGVRAALVNQGQFADHIETLEGANFHVGFR